MASSYLPACLLANAHRMNAQSLCPLALPALPNPSPARRLPAPLLACPPSIE